MTHTAHGAYPWWRTRAVLALGVLIFIGCSFNGGQRGDVLSAMDAGDNGVSGRAIRMPSTGAAATGTAAASADVVSEALAASIPLRTPRAAARNPLPARPRIVLSNPGIRERVPATEAAASTLPNHAPDGEQPLPAVLGGAAAGGTAMESFPAGSSLAGSSLMSPSIATESAPASNATSSSSSALAPPSSLPAGQWRPSIASAWDGWPWIAALALLLLVLVALRNGRKASRERAAAALPRAITWSQVKAPDAQLAQENAGFDYGNLSLPSLAVAIHMTPPRPASPSPVGAMLRHDSTRSTDARLRAIDAVADAPLVLNGALPSCVSRMSYEHIGLPLQPTSTTPHQGDTLPTVERQPPSPAVITAPAPTSSMDVAERVGQAKHALTADRPEQALAALAPLLDGDSASGEAWTVAGWAWWRIGRDRPGRQLEAAGQAASAFRNALRVEPDRANLLSRMIARCHLIQAGHQTGAARLASLDEAIAVFDRHLEGHSRDDAVLLEWAESLFERAAASPRDERPRWLDRSERVVEQRWGTTMADAGEPVQWLWINLLLARAELVDLRTAAALHARATTLLQAGIPHQGEAQHDAWLTRLIEAERAFAQRLSGAARISHLQAAQSNVEGWLASARTVNPLLAWIGLLGDWAANLHGTAAQAKLNEAESLFTRIEAISPDDGAQTRFARAYYLRMRAGREFGLTRWHTLDQARTLLAGIAAGELPQALVDLETAEIHLEQARLTEGVPQQSHFASAARLAEAAAQAPENQVRALLCALTALVALARSPSHESPGWQPQALRMKALANRLRELAPNGADALRVVASVQLATDEPQSACELCAAAWEAGAGRAELMPIWREADARWARTLDPAQQDPHWKRLHQSMRMASSTP
ncbi:hypothetical protein HIV01_016245 [Lysobacter arenosi]|uniref:Tetratricopeptide repeat protein n=1 Tax=Lysobacter arenosi TaxID=2795387 RepID=A0ABX7RCK6_9GAMM|nr:hypothetical protein [Lysobacter arenosi]QSX74699.1 hypothetical protein HIV01_016245 [Lysobacter arenosi]